MGRLQWRRRLMWPPFKAWHDHTDYQAIRASGKHPPLIVFTRRSPRSSALGRQISHRHFSLIGGDNKRKHGGPLGRLRSGETFSRWSWLNATLTTRSPSSPLSSGFSNPEAGSYRRNAPDSAPAECLRLWASWAETVHFPSESNSRPIIRLILGSGHCVLGPGHHAELPRTQTTAPRREVNTNLTLAHSSVTPPPRTNSKQLCMLGGGDAVDVIVCQTL